MDRSQMRCSSPREDYGKLWEVACYKIWNTTKDKSRLLQRMWTITMVILINVTLVFCAFSCLKKWLRYRKNAEREAERLQNTETAREMWVALMKYPFIHQLIFRILFVQNGAQSTCPRAGRTIERSRSTRNESTALRRCNSLATTGHIVCFAETSRSNWWSIWHRGRHQKSDKTGSVSQRRSPVPKKFNQCHTICVQDASSHSSRTHSSYAPW